MLQATGVELGALGGLQCQAGVQTVRPLIHTGLGGEDLASRSQ